jgi:DMSO reductase anchor subunit
VPNRWFGVVSLALALGLITAGLLSSTAHLGRPERAWRAFSQWRSSWLSREGVLSIVTFLPAVIFAFGWTIQGRTGGFVAAAGALAAICALATVFTTGMIYASLKPIPEWHSRYTVAGYLIFSVMTGAVLLNMTLRLFGENARPAAICAVLAIAIGWICKTATWRHNDALKTPVTLNSATGLKDGTVRSIEWPHTQENYVLKEMGYRVARKHARKLRLVVHALAFALPLIAVGIALLSSGIIALAASIVAVALQAAGMLVERWLFFAEARHVVALYYGR